MFNSRKHYQSSLLNPSGADRQMHFDTRGVQKVRSLTQKKKLNAENTLPVFSTTYYINTACIIFGLLSPSLLHWPIQKSSLYIKREETRKLRTTCQYILKLKQWMTSRMPGSNMELLHHPSYLPYLAPSDLYLFPKRWILRRQCNFSNDEDVMHSKWIAEIAGRTILVQRNLLFGETLD